MDQQKFNARIEALNQAVELAVAESRVEYLARLRDVLCTVLEMFVKDVQKDIFVKLQGKSYVVPNQDIRTPGTVVLGDEDFVDFLTTYWGKGLKQSDLSEVLEASPFDVTLYTNSVGLFVFYKK